MLPLNKENFIHKRVSKMPLEQEKEKLSLARKFSVRKTINLLQYI